MILRFDGSLRRPRDSGIPSIGLMNRAACAAALLSGDDDQEVVIALGGKPLGQGASSVETEYEGLILGLEEVVRQFKCDSFTGVEELIVQGDCETVIWAIEGRSKPRKMQSFYQKAAELIEAIPCPISYERIPRQMNQMCDYTAGTIVTKMEREGYHNALLHLSQLSKDCDRLIRAAHLPVDFAVTAKYEGLGRGSRLEAFWNKHASSISYMRRPFFYRHMSALAVKSKDYEDLIWIGMSLGKDIRKRLSKANEECRASPSTLDELRTEALAFQIIGLEGIGQSKEAASFRHKHRYLLSKAESDDPIEATLKNLDSLVVPVEMQDIVSEITKLLGSPLVLPNEPGTSWDFVQQWLDAASNSTIFTGEGMYWLMLPNLEESLHS